MRIQKQQGVIKVIKSQKKTDLCVRWTKPPNRLCVSIYKTALTVAAYKEKAAVFPTGQF